MSLHAKVSGAWKTANAAYIKVSGAWKQCKQVYVKVNGVWKPCLATPKTATGPSIGGSVTLNNVQVGSTITITGKFTSTFGYPQSYAQIVATPRTILFKASGASLVSSSGNGNISGTVTQRSGRGQASGVEIRYYDYSFGTPAPSMEIGPITTNYTIKLKATSSTVKISTSKKGQTNHTISLTSSISYTGS